jgi:hypothetical protein
MNLLTPEEIARYLSMPKPAGGAPGSPGYVEQNKWHYAKLVEGVELMRSGAFGATEARAKEYIEGNMEVLTMIETELAELGVVPTKSSDGKV